MIPVNLGQSTTQDLSSSSRAHKENMETTKNMDRKKLCGDKEEGKKRRGRKMIDYYGYHSNQMQIGLEDHFRNISSFRNQSLM